MLFGMICALGAAVCFGTATVLQAMAARAVGRGEGGDAALLLRALGQWRYLAGLALDGLGFLFQIAALRSLPIYAVAAALASSLAVTAVVAARLLRVRPTRNEWAAVAVVCAGLAMLGVASGTEGGRAGSTELRYAMPATAVAVLLLGPAGAVCGGGAGTWCWGSAPGSVSGSSRCRCDSSTRRRQDRCSPIRRRTGSCWAAGRPFCC